MTNAGDAAGYSDQDIRQRLQTEHDIRVLLAQRGDEPQEQPEQHDRRAGTRSRLKDARTGRRITSRPEQIPFLDVVTMLAHGLGKPACQDRRAAIVVRRAEENDRPQPVR